METPSKSYERVPRQIWIVQNREVAAKWDKTARKT